MSQEANNEKANDTVDEGTKFQFGLRALFWATLTAAVVFSISAPWVRELKNEEQIWLGLSLIALSVLIVFKLVRSFQARRSIERSLGSLLLRSAGSRRTWLRIGSILVCVFYLAFSVINVLAAIRGMTDVFMTVLFAYTYGAGIAYLISIFWRRVDHKAMEVREKGLILGDTRTLQWSEIESHRWGGVSPYHLTLQLHQNVVNWKIDPEDKDRLDELLKENEGRGEDKDRVSRALEK